MTSTIVDQLATMKGKKGNLPALLEAAGKRLKVRVALLQALVNVESGGQPFDDKGRLIILTEKHVFWRELPKALREKAQALGLATPRWNKVKNYVGLGKSGSDARWTRLADMARLHETAALRSASYGAPQIMGFNHAQAGFPTVTEFVLAFAEREDAQIAAMIELLVSFGLVAALQAEDIQAIARRYNGSGQADAYAGMISDELVKMTGGVGPITNPKVEAMLRLGSKGYRVEALQQRLIELQYHVVADGDFGPATERAIVAFQKAHGLLPDGRVGPLTEAALDVAVPLAQEPGNSREDLTVKDLRKRGSETIKSADWLSRIGALFGVVGIAGEAGKGTEGFAGIEWLNGVSNLIQAVKKPVEPIIAIFTANPILGFGLAGIVVLVIAQRLKARRLEDAKSWRHVG
ncbi:N-acetylmuramidase domain-containing protein [Devosia sp. J2-20]|uniref:N-acetylmuramidase domain-containing protein n=1 Tax=Devosia sp. J2-20 TaxID=3026161 RepID=UPI00249C3FC9|nr:N-acetylmuramidase domain-containing protein [Devosia sp. J2-20]WDR00732.1 N-acetylmuramidase domain-containing protein [Devosia sp. J2-20]